MITEITDRKRGRTPQNGKTFFENEMRGLSTDTKPAADNGDVFFEMDTCKVFMYDKAGAQWREL